MFELGFIDLIRYQKTSSKTFTSHNQPYENQHALDICGRLICSTANKQQRKGRKQTSTSRHEGGSLVVREEKVLPPSALLK